MIERRLFEATDPLSDALTSSWNLTTRGWILAISRPNAWLFGDDEAIRSLWNETPGMVMAMSDFGLVGSKGIQLMR